MWIKIKLLDSNARSPEFALEHDAGMDIFCLNDFSVAPNESVLVSTGVASEIEPGYVGLIWDKSGIANRRNLKVLGGVIDAGYRGEWLVGLFNFGREVQTFKSGDKVAQILFQRIEHPQVEVVAELSDSQRANGAFGSTGK